MFAIYTKAYANSIIGFEKISKMLVDIGANVNIIDEKRYSALQYATEKGKNFSNFF